MRGNGNVGCNGLGEEYQDNGASGYLELVNN